MSERRVSMALGRGDTQAFGQEWRQAMRDGRDALRLAALAYLNATPLGILLHATVAADPRRVRR